MDRLGSIMVEFDWPSIVLGWTGVGCDHLRKALLGRKACLGWVWLGYARGGLAWLSSAKLEWAG